jgi:hypothetical protein
MLVLQAHERHDRWSWMLNQPDQKRTFAALHRLGQLAGAEGITRAQLARIIPPAWRPWNAVLSQDLARFPLVMMVANAPAQRARPLTDEQALSLLRTRLTLPERYALGDDACVALDPVSPPPQARIVSVGRRVEIRKAAELEPGRYRRGEGPVSYVEYAFEPAAGARFVALPGLEADHDVVVSWHDGAGPWRSAQKVRLLRPRLSDLPAVIDLRRLIQWSGESVDAIRIGFTNPGVLEISGAPRLLR